jgi:hypothetical protein
MKSAYELALERLEARGIAPPRDEAFSSAVREQMAEVRRQAEAKLAELEILHQDKLRSLGDPLKRAEQEDYYRREKSRIEGERDAKVDKLRG